MLLRPKESSCFIVKYWYNYGGFINDVVEANVVWAVYLYDSIGHVEVILKMPVLNEFHIDFTCTGE